MREGERGRSCARTVLSHSRSLHTAAAQSLCSEIARVEPDLDIMRVRAPNETKTTLPYPSTSTREPEMESHHLTSTTPTGSPKRVSVCELAGSHVEPTLMFPLVQPRPRLVASHPPPQSARDPTALPPTLETTNSGT